MKQDPWGRTLTSLGTFMFIIVGDRCDGNSATTEVLHSAVPLFNIVVQILQQKNGARQTLYGGKKA